MTTEIEIAVKEANFEIQLHIKRPSHGFYQGPYVEIIELSAEQAISIGYDLIAKGQSALARGREGLG